MTKPLPDMMSMKQMELQLGLRRVERAHRHYLRGLMYCIWRFFESGRYSPTLQYEEEPEQDLSGFDLAPVDEPDA